MEVRTLTPEWDDFMDFHKYIKTLEEKKICELGIVKIIPPRQWRPTDPLGDLASKKIRPVVQEVSAVAEGIFHQRSIPAKKSLSVKTFQRRAEACQKTLPSSEEELESLYWATLTDRENPHYGADVPGSLMRKDLNVCNMQNLNFILDNVPEELPGVKTPYLYVGAWGTSFAWHTEDMDLYSMSYLHYGQPKVWYSVPLSEGKKLEDLAKEHMAECSAFMRHKCTLISPHLLESSNITYRKTFQHPGEIILTCPRGYHSGFNCGFNVAEATNFGTAYWIPFGLQAEAEECSCGVDDLVHFSMDPFRDMLRFTSDSDGDDDNDGGQADPDGEADPGDERLAEQHPAEDARMMEGAGGFNCSYCNKTFSRKQHKNLHERSHTGEKPYKCRCCGKSFIDTSSLNTHLKIHTGEKPFKCSKCEKSFRQRPHLKQHEETHGGRKPFKCRQCAQAFVQKSNLTSHARIHSGEKPFKCTQCGKAFSRPDSRKRHMKTHNNH